jgi:hypothetical protein
VASLSQHKQTGVRTLNREQAGDGKPPSVTQKSTRGLVAETRGGGKTGARQSGALKRAQDPQTFTPSSKHGLSTVAGAQGEVLDLAPPHDRNAPKRAPREGTHLLHSLCAPPRGTRPFGCPTSSPALRAVARSGVGHSVVHPVYQTFLEVGWCLPTVELRGLGEPAESCGVPRALGGALAPEVSGQGGEPGTAADAKPVLHSF